MVYDVFENKLIELIKSFISGEDLVPKPADEVAQLQGARTPRGGRLTRTNSPQQKQPQSGLERRQRRQAEARPERRARHLAGRLALRAADGARRRQGPANRSGAPGAARLPALRQHGVREQQRQRRGDQRHLIRYRGWCLRMKEAELLFGFGFEGWRAARATTPVLRHQSVTFPNGAPLN